MEKKKEKTCVFVPFFLCFRENQNKMINRKGKKEGGRKILMDRDFFDSLLFLAERGQKKKKINFFSPPKT